MKTIDALCQPQPGHGLQAMMLRWEQLHPVNAVHVAWLKNSYRPAEVHAAISRVVCRLLEADSNVPSDWAADGDEFFEFRQATVFGDWRGELQSAVTNELNAPYAIGKTPFRFSVFDAPQQGLCLMLGYRHVVADGRSIALLMHEVVHELISPSAEAPAFSARLGGKSLRQLFPSEYGWRQMPGAAWNSALSLWKSLWCKQLRPRDPGDLRMEFRIHQTSLPVAVLKSRSRQMGVTVNDLVLASLFEWFAREFPADGSRRNNLGVASLVDVNSRAPVPQPRAFGQYLSPFAVRVRPTSEMPFAEIVGLVARQTRSCKAARPLITTARSFEFLCREWDAVPLVRRPGHLPFWLPLLAGVSNVNLSRIVGVERAARAVQNYCRGMCCTNLLPMMLGVTTVRDTCSLTTTHRPALFTAGQMDDLAAHIGWRLAGADLDRSTAAA
jgi:hypothetical protein